MTTSNRTRENPRATDRHAPHSAAIAALCVSLGLIGASCAASPPTTTSLRFSASEETREFTGLARCSDDTSGVMDIDPSEPLTILVHGCGGSAGRFRMLANVFEAHDQQTLCFAYDDRARIDDVALQLHTALRDISTEMSTSGYTLIAHSQGGLVARRALTAQLPGASSAPLNGSYRLVTVSSPFGGIRSARDCGRRWLHGLTFGITVAVCRGIAGRAWRDIHERSDLVTDPGTLRSSVVEYLQLRTDERDTCRERDEDGECAVSDFVFTLAEQTNAQTLGQGALVREVRAGHVEIVGTDHVAPVKLIDVLQETQILMETSPERVPEFEALLQRLYGEPLAGGTFLTPADATTPG